MVDKNILTNKLIVCVKEEMPFIVAPLQDFHALCFKRVNYEYIATKLCFTCMNIT